MSRFALVTGADRGLGLELVKKLLSNGYNVFAGRYLTSYKGLEDLKKENAESLHIIDLDISNLESVKQARTVIENVTNELDLIVNNGAILGDIEKNIEDELDFEEIEKVISVNAVGPLKVINVFMKLLTRGEKKLIVNISSEAGSISNSNRTGWFAYCMSKAALNMESTIVNNSFKEKGGQVLVIHPGWMRTYMRDKLDSEAPLTPEYSADRICNIILNSDKFKADKAVYMDYEENLMEW
ncbi:short-chain dehydrogenase [Clostridium zeae]|uniref:Short-chain dehydrogenase n=1 Tax=Clostridium zeae TaxID=2759022 RepID=A0ABQ1EBH2_9CLOT|nr:SDR family oxidoreductase [Clostridium zeae]GFZ32179.1 short-chain dehydrogenase [Clostridium zeae]